MRVYQFRHASTEDGGKKTESSVNCNPDFESFLTIAEFFIRLRVRFH